MFKANDYHGDVVETTKIDYDGSMQTVHTQDITQLLEDNKKKRSKTFGLQKYNPKEDYHQILDLSMTDIMRIKNDHGYDVLGTNADWKYLYKLIETHYPYMKTTTARL